MRRSWSSSGWALLIVLAVFVMLGHHCVIPLPAAAAEATAHGDPTHDRAHDGPGSDDAAHPSGCHVVATKATSAAPAATSVARVDLPRVPHVRPAPALEAHFIWLGRPPRYILHAALLI